ncbi:MULTISPECIES: hypothetical protein [unclassified Microcoleus]|uniref:hypothetical protein n=1 Tax=unclassified Microcoleus TaxID=2642155 RepID=UPI002FD4C9C5
MQSWTEKHGATIAVNSTAGRGTEFTIALPVKANLIPSSQSFLQASVIPFGLTASS